MGGINMSLNNTPSSERVHIAFFGKRNAGKSSVINAVTGQQLSIVSEIKGTTTDPVKKAMELLPLGPVVVIDTPGLDDEGELGKLRVEKSLQIMNKTDIAVLVIDSGTGKTDTDYAAIKQFEKRKIPYVVVWNKTDAAAAPDNLEDNEIAVSAKEKKNIYELKELIARRLNLLEPEGKIISDLIDRDDFIVLVVPIDSAAPKGRLILPQQQTIRDILDCHANAVVVQASELKNTLDKLGSIVKAVVTDSQAFKSVSSDTPDNIFLTSFSILFARYKGNLRQNVEGAQMLDKIKDGAKVLISEGCTHHRQCGDIGTVKLPEWIKKYTGKNINFEWTSGTDFPDRLNGYDLIIHCGGCMLNTQEMRYRLNSAKTAGVPMTNYGTAIAKMNGILERSLEIFKGKY
jgi:[FeFe] hydrogenase H-cluster maturation GTPase HydF